MEENQKEYLNELFKERLHKNNNLPQLQQYEHISKQTIIKNVKYKRTTKQLVKLDLKTCPCCGQSTTYCVDYHHGERVCPQCGCVIDTVIFEKQSYPVNKLDTSRFTYKEKQYLKQKNYTYVTEAKQWKQRQIQREIDVLSSTIELNPAHKKTVEEIIQKTGLKKLHSRANSTTIICAVIRYVLKNQKHKNLVSLRYDRSIFKETLTAQQYNIVEKNIKRYVGDNYVNSSKTNNTSQKEKRKRKNKNNNKNKSRC